MMKMHIGCRLVSPLLQILERFRCNSHAYMCLSAYMCFSVCFCVMAYSPSTAFMRAPRGPQQPPEITARGKEMSTCSRLPGSDHLRWRCSLLCVLFWHVTDPFRMLSEIPEGKTTAYFSASWRQGRSIFSETLLLREFGTSAEAVLGPFPLSFNR